MERIEIDLSKGIQDNAVEYFEKAKKFKKKLFGLEKARKELQLKVQKESIKKDKKKQSFKIIKKRPKQWFERFKWFISSDGNLVIAGRDAKSNELIVKRHLEENDLFFHADIHGAATVVLKNGINASEQSKKEAAEFAAINSSAWKLNYPFVDVYCVKKNQVSFNAPSGEFIAKGSFMIYGKKTFYRKTKLNFGLGVTKKEISGKPYFVLISGPLNAIKKHSIIPVIEIIKGRKKKRLIVNKVQEIIMKKLKQRVDADEIIKMLPSGELEIKNLFF